MMFCYICSLHISLMHCDSQCTFFDEGLYTSNDSLRIEVTIKPLVETSFEVEEEQHQFAGLQPAVSAEDCHCSELELILCHIFFQSTTQTGICNQRNKPLGRSERSIHDIDLYQCWRGIKYERPHSLKGHFSINQCSDRAMIGFLSRKALFLWIIFQIESTIFQICAHSKHLTRKSP